MSNLETTLAKILSENFMNDFSLFKSVATLFLAEKDILLVPLRQAVANKDRDMLKKSAHKVKGSVSYFHSSESRQLAYQIEVTATDISFSEVSHMIDELEIHVGQLIQDLNAMLQMNQNKVA